MQSTMRWRRALVYWGVFAALALGYWWTTPRAPEPSPEELTRQQADLLRQTVIAVVVEDREMGRVEVRRHGGQWRVKSGGVVTDLVTALLEAIGEQLGRQPLAAAVNDDELPNFGLAPARVRVVLQSGEESTAFEFGARNPSGTGVYVRKRGSRAIYLWGIPPAYYAELLLDKARDEPAPGPETTE